jgi:dipeptidyl aminopeptidase/acylaminoacyl peptidase
MSDKKRLLELHDMEKLAYISAPAISPDGKQVVFVRSMADAATDTYHSRLYDVATSGGGITELFPALCANMDMPSFSPDGKELAFLMEVRGEMQIFLWDLVRNNPPRQLTTLRHGAQRLIWSPDSGQILVETKAWPDENLEVIQKEMTGKEREQWLWEREFMPRATEELMYKFDEHNGFVDGSRRRLALVETENRALKLLTDSCCHADKANFSPDGKTIAFCNYIYTHHKATRFEMFTMDLATGNTKQISYDSMYIGPAPPVFTADGKNIVYAASAEGDEGFILKPILQNIESGEKRIVYPVAEVCHGLCAAETSKTEYGTKNPAFQMHGDTLYFTAPWQGSGHLYSMNIAGEPIISQITSGEETVGTFCLPANNKLIYVKATLYHPDELFCMDLNTGEETRLTRLNPWLDEVVNMLPVPMDVPSKDGEVNIHGWVISPKGHIAGDSFPAVLYIHGGPTTSYTSGWWHEFQLLAAAGLGVVYCDPRGSTGYGAAFASLTQCWGQEAMDDLMGFLEAAGEKFPELDTMRPGVTGGSYGGYMTVKLIGRLPGRFGAAVGQRILANPATSYGTGDMGFISSAKQPPKNFKDYIQGRAKGNPMTYIDNMKVPLLLLHGMEDYRCTAEQAEQLFIAMKERNADTPVRMVLFPGENHDITRSGKITHRMRHVSEMVDWLKKYLNAKEEEGDVKG